MTPIAADKKVAKFQEMIGHTHSMGVSEFARSTAWRKQLPKAGCFEVVDRGGVVGYMLAPDYAQAINKKLAELEEQAEQAQIAALINARKNRSEAKNGEGLKSAAMSHLATTAQAMEDAINDTQR